MLQTLISLRSSESHSAIHPGVMVRWLLSSPRCSMQRRNRLGYCTKHTHSLRFSSLNQIFSCPGCRVRFGRCQYRSCYRIYEIDGLVGLREWETSAITQNSIHSHSLSMVTAITSGPCKMAIAYALRKLLIGSIDKMNFSNHGWHCPDKIKKRPNVICVLCLVSCVMFLPSWCLLLGVVLVWSARWSKTPRVCVAAALVSVQFLRRAHCCSTFSRTICDAFIIH